MTREEFIKTIEEYSFIIPGYEPDRVIYYETVRDLIDKIFDDFESRVCENCIYFKECEDGYNYCNNINNTGLNGIVTRDFGCNRFERR